MVNPIQNWPDEIVIVMTQWINQANIQKSSVLIDNQLYNQQIKPIMHHPITRAISSQILKHKSPSEVTYLDLSGIECKQFPPQAKKMLEQCNNIYQLNLSACGLESLLNLPKLDLTILQLNNNNLKTPELNHLYIYQSTLEILSLEKNLLFNIGDLSTFTTFTKLEQLDLKGNPLTKNQKYASILFNQILKDNKSLSIIDQWRKREGEVISEDDSERSQEEYLPMAPYPIHLEDEDQSEQSNQFDLPEPNQLISMYQKQPNYNPSFLVQYLNKNEIFNDPLDNCLDDDCLDEDEDDQMDFEAEIEDDFADEIKMEQFSYKQEKKRKE